MVPLIANDWPEFSAHIFSAPGVLLWCADDGWAMFALKKELS